MQQPAPQTTSVVQPKLCSICNVNCPNADSYNQHVNGKRHQMLVSRLENTHDRDDRTVFIQGDRNFTQLSELSLSDYFCQFGQIRRVKYFKERGYAFVEFTEKSHVDQVLAVQHHLIPLGRFHCKLYVRLCRHATPQQLQRSDLAYRKQQQEKEEQFRNLKTNALSNLYSDALADQVESGSDLSTQLVILSSEIGLTDESLATANQVAIRVEFVVNKLARQRICRAALFGSKISTFGLKSSDVDLVLLFNVKKLLPPHLVKLYCVEDSGAEMSGEDDDAFLAPCNKKQRLLFNLDAQSQLATKSQIAKMKQVAAMLRCYQDFSCIMPIKARIPIVRCLHVPTSTQIDISIDSLLSINNSHLLKLYSLYDHRIRPLVLVVRYWAKIQEICPAPLFLTSYALTWLVLYFLQTRTPPVCPTVAELASLARKTGETEVILSTWNATYLLDLAKWPLTQNTESLQDLFSNFFYFYANFSFAESAIILRDATTTPVQNLVAMASAKKTKVDDKPLQKDEKKQPSCSEERCCSCGDLVKEEPGEPDNVKKEDSENDDDEAEQEETFRLSVMNVQDPIELTRNVASLVNSRNLDRIQTAFKVAANIFHSNENAPQKVLRQLFKKIEPQAAKTSAKGVVVDKQPQTSSSGKGKTLTVALSPNSSVIHARSLDWFRRIRIPQITLRWLCSAVSAIGITSLLRNMLLFELQVVENNIPPEAWQTVNPNLAAQLGIIVEPPKESINNDPILMPMFVPASTAENKDLSATTTSKSDTKEIFVKFNCTARFPTWNKREEAGTVMRRNGQCPTASDGRSLEPVANDFGLAFETQISKWIAFSGGESVSKNEPISFVITIFSCPSTNKKQDDIRCELSADPSSVLPSKLFSSIGSLVTKRFIDSISAL